MWTVVPDIYNVITARIFRLQYSAVGNCAVIVDITAIQCALYCKFGAKYSANPPVYASWTVVQVIYNVITARHIQASIIKWTYRGCHWRYLDNSMCVIVKTWCLIQLTPSGLPYVNCGPRHIQCSCNYPYSGFNIRLNVSALPLEISRQFNVRYTANLVPNTAHTLRFALYELCSRTYTMHFQLHIFRLQYSTERICAAIGVVSTILCLLNCKLGAQHSAHPAVCAMWTVVGTIYDAIIAQLS
jgi:hypothetical protein